MPHSKHYYDNDFKAHAVQLLLGSGKGIKTVARELGVSDGSLRNWKNAFLADEIRRVTAAARDNSATREELTGSTITLTSLGRLGGIVSTPVINAPETAIIGVNKAVDAPVVRDGQITVRRMMNLSSSFDHRFVDGYDGASLIAAVKAYLEEPATIFISD